MLVCFILLLAAIFPSAQSAVTCFYEDLASHEILNITGCERIIVGWISIDEKGYTHFSGAKHYGQGMLSLKRLASQAHKYDPPVKVHIGVTSVKYGYIGDKNADQETIFGYLSSFVLNANVDGFIFVLPEEEINSILSASPITYNFWKSIYSRMKSGSDKIKSAAHILAISPKLLVDTATLNTTAVLDSFSSVLLLDPHQISMCNESGTLPKFKVVGSSSEQAGTVSIAKGKLVSYGMDQSLIEIALGKTECTGEAQDDSQILSLMSPCEAASFLNAITGGDSNGGSHTANHSSLNCSPPARNGCQFICTFSTTEHYWQTTGLIDFEKIGLQSSWCTHVVVRGGTIYRSPPLSSTVDFDKSVQNAISWIATITDDNIKPKLLVGYGDSTALHEWDAAVRNENKIQKLAKNLYEAVTERKADGIEITLPHDTRLEKEEENLLSPSLENRILRLLKALRVLALQNKTDTVIVANLNHGIRRPFANELQIYADLIVIPADRLRRFGEVTHRSHLLESTAFSQPGQPIKHMPNIEKLWESFVQHNIPKDKLILSLNVHSSAVGFDFDLPYDNWDGTYDLGAPAERINNWYAPRNRPPALIHNFFTQENATLKTIQRSHEPYLHDESFLLSFDNLQSIRTKAIWASIQDAGGFAFVNAQSDTSPKPELSELGLDLALNDRSLNKGPFLLLRQLRKHATCRKDCYRSTAPLRRCGKLDEYDSFQAICFYRLRAMQNPPSRDQELSASHVPYSMCDGVVIDNFATINGKLTSPVQECSKKDQHTIFDCDTEQSILAMNSRKAGLELTAMFRLAMTSEDFNSMMVTVDEMDAFISRIVYFLQIDGNKQLFSGLLLNLATIQNPADLMKNPAEKKGFIGFLEKLTAALPDSKYIPDKKCQFSLDLMVSALPKFDLKVNLPVIAEFETLIRFVFIDDEHIPFFDLPSDESSSVSKTLEAWNQVKTKIILNTRSSINVTEGKERRVNYGRVCSNSEDFDLERAQQKREREKFTLLYESEATLRIKSSYISENGFRGVSVSVDGDDHQKLCRGNAYPLLSVLQNYRC